MTAEARNTVILEESIGRWKDKPGNLLMILKEIQEALGYIPRNFALTISEHTGQPLARVYEALTFYSFFNLEKPGKVRIAVCTGTTCFLNGAGNVLKEFKNQLNIREGDTTSDGLFHLATLRCIGCCGIAPAVMIGKKVYGHMTPEKVGTLIYEWRNNGL
jgi:NADH-quinone oxidoreductase subunit E